MLLIILNNMIKYNLIITVFKIIKRFQTFVLYWLLVDNLKQNTIHVTNLYY